MRPVLLLCVSLPITLLFIGCGEEKGTSDVLQSAAEESADINPEVLRHEIHGNAVTITGCSEHASGRLVIPATIEGQPVTSIGKSAFYNCASLTSIMIPDSVTSIGERALWDLGSLTSISIPDGITSIGRDAF